MQARVNPQPIHSVLRQNDQYVDNLRQVICEIAQKLENKAPHLKLYSNSEQNKRTFELYRSFPEPQKKRIYEDVSKYNAVIDSMTPMDPQISNKSALWVALKLFGLPKSLEELFNYIEESDIIEVYRYDQIQVFRNLNFHDVCSYELPELFIYPWDQLFYRPNPITQKIADGAQAVFSGKHNGILDLESLVGEHPICETFSPKRHKLKMCFKYFYPLRNKNNQVEYLVALSKVQVETQNFDYRGIDSIPLTPSNTEL